MCECVRKLIERCGSRVGASRSAMRRTPPRLGCCAGAAGAASRTARSATETARARRRAMADPPAVGAGAPFRRGAGALSILLAPAREVAAEAVQGEEDDPAVAPRRLAIVRGVVPPRGQEESGAGERGLALHVLERLPPVLDEPHARGVAATGELAEDRALRPAGLLAVDAPVRQLDALAPQELASEPPFLGGDDVDGDGPAVERPQALDHAGIEAVGVEPASLVVGDPRVAYGVERRRGGLARGAEIL